MPGETTTTSLNDLIPSERIDEITLEANRAAQIHQMVAWYREGGQGATHVFPRNDATNPPAGTKTEAAEFTLVEHTTDSAVATPGVVGLGRQLTGEANQDAVYEIEELIRQNIIGMGERLSTDVLALNTGATNTSDFSGTALDLTKWGTAKSLFVAQFPVGSELAFIGHNSHIRDLEAAMRVTGAQFLTAVRGELSAMFNTNRGYKGMFEGYHVFETGLVPEYDVSNNSGAFVSLGYPGANGMERGVYGLAVWDGLKHRLKPAPESYSDKVYTSARYGVVLTNPANIREVVSIK